MSEQPDRMTVAEALARIAPQDIARLKALLVENDRLRLACKTGWGEPTLINLLEAERDAARAQLATLLRDPGAQMQMAQDIARLKALLVEARWYVEQSLSCDVDLLARLDAALKVDHD